MNKFRRFLNKGITIVSIIIIIWYIAYFFVGKYILLEWKDNHFAYVFPDILVFVSSVAIYLLFLLWIKTSKRWHYTNILKFFGGIVFAFIPIFVYAYLNFGECPFWKYEKTTAKVLYYKIGNPNEKIIVQQKECKTLELKQEHILHTTPFTPIAHRIEHIDTAVIKKAVWKKVEK